MDAHLEGHLPSDRAASATHKISMFINSLSIELFFVSILHLAPLLVPRIFSYLASGAIQYLWEALERGGLGEWESDIPRRHTRPCSARLGISARGSGREGFFWASSCLDVSLAMESSVPSWALKSVTKERHRTSLDPLKKDDKRKGQGENFFALAFPPEYDCFYFQTLVTGCLEPHL